MSYRESTATQQIPRMRRRGASITLVLSIIAITLATSYAIMRSQYATLRIQQNDSRRTLARQAAIIGLSVGMRKMEESTWAGVGTTVTGNISSQESYQVTFSTGDPLLTSASSNYSEYPYRVTIQATGYSIDPNNTQSRATYKMTAVRRFLPRQLATEPTSWANMQNYTIYQTDTKNLAIDPPCQISGPVYLQGAVSIGNDYNWTSLIEQQYLGDLNSMRLAGLGDYRPFTGVLSLPTGSSTAANLSLLTSQLGLTLNNISTASTITLPTPNNLTTYRLYPGGKVYNVGTAGSSITNTTLSADPINNPLGIFFNSGSISVGSNVTINGTLVSGGEIDITGSGVVLTANNMLPMSGSTAPVRLPVLVCKNNFYFSPAAQASITGVVITGSKFWIDAGSQTNVISIVGRVMCAPFVISARTQWNLGATAWTTDTTTWKLVKALVPYFPVWMSSVAGLNYVPSITVKQDTTAYSNHWFDLTTGPIFVINTTDTGLRWDLVDWRENQ